ncbi:MAG: sugar ABC transporter ATP-binding protein [Bacteroidota bacterium]
MTDPIIQISSVHKSFGPVKALKGVSMKVHPGTVHALIGENGAGKSTLMKILSGALKADKGKIEVNGEVYTPESPLDGRKAGISMIYQELNLAPHLSIEKNVTLGMEKNSWGWVHSQGTQVEAILSELGQGELSADLLIRDLSIGKQQVVEIARALLFDAQVVVMDEPTSSLSAADTRTLFQVINRLKKKGVAVIYISHFLEEIQEIADHYTILRDGETVASGSMEDIPIEEIIFHMVGREVSELYPTSKHTLGEVILRGEDIQGAAGYPNEVDLELRKGEILGIAGLVGSGRSETVRMLFGLDKAQKGTLQLKSGSKRSIQYQNPQKAIGEGINLLSENRKEEGLALNLSLLHNLTLPVLKNYQKRGILDLKSEHQQGQMWLDELRVKAHNAHQRADSLSGGNQQKVCIARLLHADSEILILDEPTRGIDIGSKSEIYRLILRLAGNGKAIIMVSSYLPELFGICDSLSIMHKGYMSPKRPISEWTEVEVMHYATSGEQRT